MLNRSVTRPYSAIASASLLAVLLGLPTPRAEALGQPVEVWLSSEFNPKNVGWFTTNWESQIPFRLARQTDLLVQSPNGAAVTTLTVNPAVQFQTIDGFGTSLEETTVFNLMRLSAANRAAVLNQIFGSTGIGMNMSRIPFGTADFTGRPFYTYDDIPAGQTDPGLAQFSIQKDIDFNIINVLQQTRSINPQLRLMGSPWSPPGWMKSSGSIVGGSLQSQWINTLATYYRRAIQAYHAQNLPIDTLTLQNEPLLQIGYPSCLISAAQEATLVRALRTELNAAGLSTKLLVFDHNFSEAMSYAGGVFADTAALNAATGVAFHDYAGQPTAMTSVRNAWPAKEMHMTERMVWGTAGADRIAQYMRNWARSYMSWVTVLDSNRGPEQFTGVPDPSMIIINAGSPNTFWRTPEYYIMGNFSKFVQRNARRIDSNYGSTGTVTNVAFLNPDGTVVAVVINQTASNQSFKILVDGEQISATLPARTVATYKWARSGAATPTPTATARTTATPTATTARPTPTPTSGTGAISTTAWYSVVNRNSNKCVDARAAASANGTVVQQFTCNATFAQQWQFQVTSGGYYRVVTRNAANQVWDVAGVSIADGGPIQLWTYGGGNNQQWLPTSLAGGYWQFAARHTGKCLEVPASSIADSVQLQQRTCNGTNAQQFLLQQQ